MRATSDYQCTTSVAAVFLSTNMHLDKDDTVSPPRKFKECRIYTNIHHHVMLIILVGLRSIFPFGLEQLVNQNVHLYYSQ